MDWLPVAASVVTALLSFLGVYLSNKKQTALMEYRLKQLEDKVDKHNSFDRRIVAIETKLGMKSQ